MARTKTKRRVMTRLALAARAGRTALTQRLAGQGLYSGQDAVLLAIGKADGLSMRDLAVQLSVRPPTVTKTVARLAAQGLLEKRIAAGDGRQASVHLTERGAALLGEIRTAQKAVERTATAGLSGRDRRQLRRLLGKVERNLSEASGADPGDDAG